MHQPIKLAAEKLPQKICELLAHQVLDLARKIQADFKPWKFHQYSDP